MSTDDANTMFVTHQAVPAATPLEQLVVIERHGDGYCLVAPTHYSFCYVALESLLTPTHPLASHHNEASRVRNMLADGEVKVVDQYLRFT